MPSLKETTTALVDGPTTVEFIPCMSMKKKTLSSDLGLKNVTDTSTFLCHLCAQKCAKALTLTEHFISKHRLFACGFCCKEFSNSQRLRNHTLTHTNERKCLCTKCGNTYKRKHHLKSHIESVHNKKRKFSCSVCQKTFKRSCHLRSHVETHGERSFKCGICQVEFIRAANLKQHMLIHTAERHHKCLTCGKSFKVPYHLKKHMKSHINDNGHECKVCGKTFKISKPFLKHIQRHPGYKSV